MTFDLAAPSSMLPVDTKPFHAFIPCSYHLFFQVLDKSSSSCSLIHSPVTQVHVPCVGRILSALTLFLYPNDLLSQFFTSGQLMDFNE